MSFLVALPTGTNPYYIFNLFRADSVYNTEIFKDSRFLDAKEVIGSQQLLIKVFNEPTLPIQYAYGPLPPEII